MLNSQIIAVNSLTSSTNRVNLLKAIARNNCQNLTGNINFNKYGCKDNVGLIPTGSHFFDTIIVEKYLSNTQLELIDEESWRSVVAKQMYNIFGKLCQGKIDIIVTSFIKSEKKFRIQIPTCNIPPSDVLEAIESESFKTDGYIAVQIDITRDFCGSFDLDEIIDYFTKHHNLQTEPSDTNYYMRANMEQDTGHTCFVIRKGLLRYKIYLKMPQNLQTFNTREDLGNHWLDWCKQNDFLGTHITESSQRGLTRIEITIPYNSETTELEYFTNYIDNFHAMIPKSLIYSTPHSAMWTSYADCFKHTLIVADEYYNSKGLAILIYSYDETSKNLSGFTINDWSKQSTFVMSRFSLAAHLPIHLITVSTVSRYNGNEMVEVQGACYQKTLEENTPDRTYLTNRLGNLSYCKDMTPDKLNTAGFISHKNCTPYLPNKKYLHSSKSVAKLALTDEFNIHLNQYKFTSKQCYNKSAPIYNKSPSSTPTISPISSPHQSPTQLLHTSERAYIKLRHLERGYYSVYGIESISGEYPILVILCNGQFYNVSCNQLLASQIHKLNLSNCLEHSPIGNLCILYSRKRKSGCYNVECNFKLTEF